MRNEFLQDAYFPDWKGDVPKELDDPEEMEKRDPLATSIWRLYSQTKSQLPNKERMENLTWRMMAMKLRKQKEQEEKDKKNDPRYITLSHFCSPRPSTPSAHARTSSS